MKKILLLAITISIWHLSHSQTTQKKYTLEEARAFLNKKKKYYNPDKAVAIMKDFANAGNGEAMNDLGILYITGTGVQQNDAEAAQWFTKATEKNYGNAFYNLGQMHKNGVGFTQNFEKALDLYQQGAAFNSDLSYYSIGYMYYKGLGCAQSYAKAIPMFKKAAGMNNRGAMFMMGLCYRNGYGIEINLDSAKYWLTKSADLYCREAKEELASAQPENLNLTNLPDIQSSAIKKVTMPLNLKNGYQKINNRFEAGDISGDYNGYVIKFDWSGKYVIGQSALHVTFERNGKKLTGKWEEDESAAISFSASLKDTAIVFDNVQQDKNDHYNQNAPNEFVFKDAKLELAKNGSDAFITGNLQLFSLKHNEPEKPTFIILARSTATSDSLTKNGAQRAAKTDSLHFIAYPNPFTNILNVRYTLKHAARVNLFVSSVLNGSIVYKSEPEQLMAGDHTKSLTLNSLPGPYVITIQYDDKLKSTIVFKQ